MSAPPCAPHLGHSGPQGPIEPAVLGPARPLLAAPTLGLPWAAHTHGLRVTEPRGPSVEPHLTRAQQPGGPQPWVPDIRQHTETSQVPGSPAGPRHHLWLLHDETLKSLGTAPSPAHLPGSLARPLPQRPPTRPQSPVCSLRDPVISGEHTQEVRPGRAQPSPDLHGTEHKKPPFLAPGGASLPESAVPMAKSEAPAERTGRRLLEVPRGGRRGVGPIPGQRRQLWLPWPSLGPGSVRYGGGSLGGAGSGQSGISASRHLQAQL